MDGLLNVALFCYSSFKITFCPLSAKYFQEEVVLICDNCQVKEYTIEGRVAQISMNVSDLAPRANREHFKNAAVTSSTTCNMQIFK